MAEDSPGVELLEGFLDAFNRHDIDAIMEFMGEDCVFETPRGPDPSDIHYGEDRHWVSGDRGVSEWTITGTDTAGNRVEVQGCDLLEFRDGKIARKDAYWKIVE